MKMEIRKIPGGVTAPLGFSAASCMAGIKYRNRTDMAMIFSQSPCCAAGTFTSNMVKAAPVVWDREIVYAGDPVQAVVVNSGIANAGTGPAGMEICEKTARAVGARLGIPARSVLIGSTGVIGMQIPIDRIEAGVGLLADGLGHSLEKGTEASRAIMTTDTVNKEFACTFSLPAADGTGSVPVTIGGMSKGSGMIHPNMCTMLSFVVTDAVISKEALTALVKADVRDTYNMISVDGDTSTNDTFIVMANGMAGNPEILPGTPDHEAFKEALHFVNETQAKRLAGDGEGATALVECVVKHADTKENARVLARSVISSNLTKAAVFGRDANWGRILCALGYSGARFDPEQVELFYEGGGKTIQIYKDGLGVDFDEEEASAILSLPEVRIIADMKAGEETATAWGCDLTYDYVKINGDYRT